VSDHYFTAHPETGHRPGQVHVLLPDVHLELATDAGVFSPSRVDPGTRLLLDVAADPPGGPPAEGGKLADNMGTGAGPGSEQAGLDLLDLGSGYGPIALVLARRAPTATVWAVDVNERALDLCARNAARAGLSNVRCVMPGDSALPATFAGIWSNPPIRIGKQALHDLLGGWLPRLAPGAAATAVVQRHLGADSLHRWLTEQGWDVSRIAARAGYRVLRITRPPASGTAPSEAGPSEAAPSEAAP
jgi:16S rRNA (guanine1207-N2)-methyltransferase